MNYKIKTDIDIVLNLKGINIDTFSELCNIPKRTIFYNFNDNPSNSVLEGVYNTFYKLGIRLSATKSEILEEINGNKNVVLYHGSKYGITKLSNMGSRMDCDFGSGFYLTKHFTSARNFIETTPNSSVYAFSISLKDLHVVELNCDLEWMLTICYYRNKINKYKNSLKIKELVNKVEQADIIIAPIADNKMFEIINKFANDEITTLEAMHALSASRLGKQYVIKSIKALKKLNYKDRFYMCSSEREESMKISCDNVNIIQSKLEYAKHKYRTEGKYLSEVLNETV